MEKDFRAEIGALVQDRKQAYTDMSDRIWEWKPEPELQDDLRQHLKDEMKIWRIQSLFVITPQEARKKHFII